MGTRLLTVAEATHDAAMRLAAHNALGIMAFYGGEFDAALAHLDRGTELYDPEQHSPDRSPAAAPPRSLSEAKSLLKELASRVGRGLDDPGEQARLLHPRRR